MGVLKNQKHERFAQAVVKGETLRKAYISAGYADNEKNAARLKKNEGVAARIEELQERVAKKVETTAADIAKQLDEDRDFARDLEHSSAAVSATMGKAKVLGLIINQQKHSFDFSAHTDEELEILESLLAKASHA